MPVQLSGPTEWQLYRTSNSATTILDVCVKIPFSDLLSSTLLSHLKSTPSPTADPKWNNSSLWKKNQFPSLLSVHIQPPKLYTRTLSLNSILLFLHSSLETFTCLPNLTFSHKKHSLGYPTVFQKAPTSVQQSVEAFSYKQHQLLPRRAIARVYVFS